MAKKKGEQYNAVIEAAVKVISANGYSNSPVSEIAKAAGIEEETVYLYFDSIEEIMAEVFNQFLGDFIEEIWIELVGITNSAEKLKMLTEAYLYKLEANYDLAVVYLVELRQSELRLAAGEELGKYFRLIEQIVDDGVANGSFKPNLNKYIARQMIFGTLNEIVTGWVHNPRSGLAVQAPQVYNMLLTGLVR